MSGTRLPPKPELPETPFGHSSSPQTASGQQRPAPHRLTNRDSERWYRQPPILEDQEQQQQQQQEDTDKVIQNFSSRDSERLRDPGSRSQLGSRDSVRTVEFPSKASTRASSANSRCPFLPCHSCVESCLETQDAQLHYRPSWVSCLSQDADGRMHLANRICPQASEHYLCPPLCWSQIMRWLIRSWMHLWRKRGLHASLQ